MPRFFPNRSGFTLIELIMASLFAMTIMGVLYSFFRQQLFALLSQETRTANLEDSRGALDMMIRELRNAGAFPVTTNGTCAKDVQNVPLRVIAASADSIQTQSDLDGNGACDSGENVTFSFSTSATQACPGENIKRNGLCLVANVIRPTGKLFAYYDSSGTLLPDTPSNPGDIRRVKITFGVEVKNPDPSIGGNLSTAFSSSVEFRN